MKTKYLTLAQCERIIANNYLGEPSKSGRQVDYGDFAIEINARYWELSDRKLLSKQHESVDIIDSKPIISRSEQVLVSFDTWARTFNKWRYLGAVCSG